MANPLAVIGRFACTLAVLSGALLTASASAGQTPVFGATGDRRELVVGLYPAGGAPGDLASESFAARAQQFQSTLSWWSYGRLRVTATWQGWLAVPIAPVCNLDSLAVRTAGDQALVAAGVSVTPYAKITYLTSWPCESLYAGVAGIGSRTAVLHGSTTAWEHEALHRYGLYHSGLRQLNESDGRYYLTDMGNQFSIMGGWRDVNGPERVRLGWLPASQVRPITASQEVEIQQLDIADSAGVKLLRIDGLGAHENWQMQAAGPALVQPFTILYIELRQTSSQPLVVVHGAYPLNTRWWHVATIGVGTWTWAGVTIDVLAIGATTARVRVTPLSSTTPALQRPPSNVRIP